MRKVMRKVTREFLPYHLLLPIMGRSYEETNEENFCSISYEESNEKNSRSISSRQLLVGVTEFYP